jgi:hypothetical protein
VGLLHSPKQKIVKFHAQKQIGKRHVIDIFTSEDMEDISLCILQYLTLYYIIMKLTLTFTAAVKLRTFSFASEILSRILRICSTLIKARV